MKRPKGYRQITVHGRVWYWMVTKDLGVLARAADTGERAHITGQQLSALVPGCPEMLSSASENTAGEFNQYPVVTPRHVAAWLSTPWVPANRLV